MHNAELASIHSPLQQAFMVEAASKMTNVDSFWIGLNSLAVWDQFTWSDESEVDFDNWNSDEPNGYGAEPCVEMFATGEHAGKWNDVDCGLSTGYICEVRASDNYPEPEPEFPACANSSLSEQGFVQQWQFSDTPACYLHVKEERTMREAEEYCRQFGDHTHLLSVADIVEEDFAIVYTFEDKSDNLWLGLEKEEVK